jgi:hypothetical protein
MTSTTDTLRRLGSSVAILVAAAALLVPAAGATAGPSTQPISEHGAGQAAGATQSYGPLDVWLAARLYRAPASAPQLTSEHGLGQMTPTDVVGSTAQGGTDGDFDWGDAGLGALSGAACLLVAFGAAIAMRRHDVLAHVPS